MGYLDLLTSRELFERQNSFLKAGRHIVITKFSLLTAEPAIVFLRKSAARGQIYRQRTESVFFWPPPACSSLS